MPPGPEVAFPTPLLPTRMTRPPKADQAVFDCIPPRAHATHTFRKGAPQVKKVPLSSSVPPRTPALRARRPRPQVTEAAGAGNAHHPSDEPPQGVPVLGVGGEEVALDHHEGGNGIAEDVGTPQQRDPVVEDDGGGEPGEEVGVGEPEQVRDEPRLQAVDFVQVDDPCGGKMYKPKCVPKCDSSWLRPRLLAFWVSVAQALV